ncbi:hypothetical protein HK097_002567 [Rhizophlyctis rosea]|uniref:TmcB/TmcC TPR repeats domain-containing protein n=1 Tax=Rhizophlyctis rosea TaxID=64517 RepID=A0AAD5X434_9FUNG|nr:hypothetical protein HK097_002567 [Rhizophlyctis rosea]
MSYQNNAIPPKFAFGGTGVKAVPQSGAVEFVAFTVLHEITQSKLVNNIISVSLIFFTEIQYLAYTFEPKLGFHSLPEWMPYLFSPLRYQPTSGKDFRALFYFACFLYLFSLVLQISVGLSAHGVKIPSKAPVHICRPLTRLSHSVLFLPILEILLRGLLIYDYDGESSLTYLWKDRSRFSKDLEIPVLAGIGLVYLAVQAPFISSMHFQMTPSTKNLNNRTTGRIDGLSAILRIILAVTHQVVRIEASAQIAVVTISAFMLFYLVARYQPSYSNWVNDLRCGIFMATFVTGIIGGIGKSVGFYDAAGFVVMVAMMVPAFVCGFGGSALMRYHVTKGVYGRLKARQAPDSPQSKDSLEKSSFSKIKISRPHDIESARQPHLPLALSSPAQEDLDIFSNLEDIVTTRVPRPVPIFRSVSDVELACRFLQNIYQPDKKTLTAAYAIFAAGLEQFPDSAWLCLIMAEYTRAFGLRDRSQVAQYMHQAKLSHPALDDRFFIFVQERQLEQEDRKGDLDVSSWNLKRHSELIALEENARKWHLESLLALKSMWEYLKSDSAAADCLPYILEQLARNRGNAKKFYQQMLSKYPNSKQVLRKYSSYLIAVENDCEQAKKLLERAEDIENAEARQKTMQSANMRLRDEAYAGDPNDQEARHIRDMVPAIELENQYPTADRFGLAPPSETDSRAGRTSVGFSDQHEGNNQLFLPSTNNSQPRRTSLAASSLPPVHENSASVEDSVKRTLDFAPVGSEADVSNAAEGYHEDDVAIQKTSLMNKEREWKRGPGSLPSAPSATSSQRETRQYKYLKGILDARLTLPIDKAQTFINVSFVMYFRQIKDIATGKLIATSPQAVKEARIQLTINRTVSFLYGRWRDQFIPTLMQYNLNDEATIKVKRILPNGGSIVSYNAYFLAQELLSHAMWITNRTMAEFFTPAFTNSPHLNFWLRNAETINRAFNDVARKGYLDFLHDTTANMNVMIGLLVAVPIAVLLFGMFVLRPTILKNTQREVQIASMALQLPRKFINERIEALELEVENIMEEIAEVEQTQMGHATAFTSTSGTLPPAAIMRGHSKRTMIKNAAFGLLLVAITGAVMFIPPLQQSYKSRDLIVLIEQLSARAFVATSTAMFASEVMSADTDVWLPGDPKMWLQDYADQYRNIDEIIMLDGGGVPSIQRFKKPYTFIYQEGLCYVTTSKNACDVGNRPYYPQVGLSQQTVYSNLVQISATWYNAVIQFLNLTPDQLPTMGIGYLVLITELMEDITGAAPTLNSLLTSEINTENNSARALNIFFFCLSLLILIASYVFIFRWTTNKLKEKLLIISDLYFSLPVALVQSIPDLKRFLESGGAIIPATDKRK